MNHTNITIHIIFVPVIFFTSFVLLSNIPYIPLPAGILPFQLHITWILAAVNTSFYILMDPVAGSLAAPLVLGATAYANHVCQAYGAEANKWAGVLQVIAWISQFIGHGVYEKIAPALLDNLVQALLLAPFFVFLEVSFMVGYRPELKARLDASTKKARKELEEKKSKKALTKA
jgi:uncharacterized membrane protein YGL010W